MVGPILWILKYGYTPIDGRSSPFNALIPISGRVSIIKEVFSARIADDALVISSLVRPSKYKVFPFKLSPTIILLLYFPPFSNTRTPLK